MTSQPIKTNLQELEKTNPAPFSNQAVENFFEKFTKNGIYFREAAASDTTITDVPVANIIGIDQLSCLGTWRSALFGAGTERMSRRLDDLQINPDYYLGCTPKQGIKLLKVNNDYYIKAGKHRCIIAKYLAHFNPECDELKFLRGVEVVTQHIDYLLIDYLALEPLINEIRMQYENLIIISSYSKDHAVPWVTIEHKYSQNFKPIELTRENAKPYLEQLKSGRNAPLEPKSDDSMLKLINVLWQGMWAALRPRS